MPPVIRVPNSVRKDARRAARRLKELSKHVTDGEWRKAHGLQGSKLYDAMAAAQEDYNRHRSDILQEDLPTRRVDLARVRAAHRQRRQWAKAAGQRPPHTAESAGGRQNRTNGEAIWAARVTTPQPLEDALPLYTFELESQTSNLKELRSIREPSVSPTPTWRLLWARPCSAWPMG